MLYRDARWPIHGWLAYLCLGGALAVIVGLGVWWGLVEMSNTRRAVLQSEVGKLRLRAIRVVGQLEGIAERYESEIPEYRIENQDWFRPFWQRNKPEDSRVLYVAIVNADGVITAHSDPQRQGGRLPQRWYAQVLNKIGNDVVEVIPGQLSLNKPAYDVQIPIYVRGHHVGTYHEGLDAGWFEGELVKRRSELIQHWALVVGGTLLVVVAGGVSLFYLASRSAALRKYVNVERLHRAAELGHLAAGLAHEIRNPLHALRLNLQTLAKAYRSDRLSKEDVDVIVGESNSEIDRIDRLLTELLGFARPEAAKNEHFDLRDELQSTIDFLKGEFRQKNITVQFQCPDSAVAVRMDRARMRQILLNLLINSHDALAHGGQIEINLRSADRYAEIRIADDGPGIGEDVAAQMFQPFFSTKEQGSGLGLPLVHRFLEDAGGRVYYTPNDPHGAVFTLKIPLAKLPRAKKARKGKP